MHWEIRPDRPVYLQLVEQMELAVATGEWAPGARIAPVRDKMVSSLASLCGLDEKSVAIAAGTCEKLGFVGEGLGIMAYASVLVRKI